MRTTEFKDTELGPIPKDWEVKRLGEVCDTSSGGTPPRSVPDFYNGPIKWFTTSELRDCYLCDSAEHICQSALEASSAKIFPSGTLLMAMYGATIGRLGMLTDEAATNQACCAIFCNDCDVEFLFYYLLHNRARIISLGSGAGQPNISQQIVKDLQLSLPPLPEQRRIAAALGDVDKLIENLKKRVEKKKNLKRGAMQELLTGMRRLKGFTGAWVEKRLGEFVECLRGVSYDGNCDLFAVEGLSTIRLLRSNNIQGGVFVDEDVQYVSRNCASDDQVLRQGDIMVCMANGSKSLVGKSCIFRRPFVVPYTFGAFMGGIRAKEAGVCMEFIYYLMNSDVYWQNISFLLAGSSINNLRPNHVLEMVFSMPSERAEQRAIAAVLSDMDAEIANLEHKLKKMTLLKQGMMQDLLTGKVRLT